MTKSSAAEARRPLLDAGGVGNYLGTSERHIRRLVSERRIPHTKVGGLVRFSLDDIDQWLAENKREPSVACKSSDLPLAPVRSITRRRAAQTEPRNLPRRQFRPDQQQ